MMDAIYTVTAVGTDGQHRCWGWFHSPEAADVAIRADNNNLIFEGGTFEFAIVEKVPHGIMGRVALENFETEGVQWYAAHYQSDGTYVIEALSVPPAIFEGVAGYSMG